MNIDSQFNEKAYFFKQVNVRLNRHIFSFWEILKENNAKSRHFVVFVQKQRLTSFALENVQHTIYQ